VKETHMNLL